MGQRPRSGDIPWLPAHSILNWIGGDTFMLVPSPQKSSILCTGNWALDNWPKVQSQRLPHYSERVPLSLTLSLAGC